MAYLDNPHIKETPSGDELVKAIFNDLVKDPTFRNMEEAERSYVLVRLINRMKGAIDPKLDLQKYVKI